MPFSREALSFCYLRRRHFGGNLGAQLFCILVILRGGEVEPKICFYPILRDTSTLRIMLSETVLRSAVTLVSGLLVQFDCFTVVL